MNTQRNRRLLALVVALAGPLLLQACAVSTGVFVPSKGARLSSMDMLHYQAAPVAAHLMTTSPGRGGLFDFRYY